VCALLARLVFPGQLLLAALVMFAAGVVARYAVTRSRRQGPSADA
jgi:hypothetical protein